MQDEKDIKNQESTNESLDESLDSEIVDFEYNIDGEEDLKKTLKKIRTDLKEAKKEKEEYLIGWQKERADFANYKKEENTRMERHREIVREQILESFLVVVDSFNMAFSNKEAWEKVDTNWRTGVEYIYNQMKSVFEDYGVKTFGEQGEMFDPNIHESVELVETNEEQNDHKIALVIQKGYNFKPNSNSDQVRILRPAKVKIFGYKK